MTKTRPFTQRVPYQETPETLTIIGQDTTYIYIETNLDIYPGQVFKFNEGYGVALDQGLRSRIQPRFPLYETISNIERHKIRPFSNIPKPLISVSPSDLGSLEANCVLKPKYPKGSLGWTLTYQPFEDEDFDREKPLVQYHDYYNRGVCLLNATGNWKPGIYTLYVTLHDLEIRKPIKTKNRSWDLSQPQSILGCGLGYTNSKINFL